MAKYTTDDVRRAVEWAVRSWAVAIPPDRFAADVVQRLGRAEGDGVALHGWRAERIAGKDIPGFKGRGKKYQGWKLTDSGTGAVRYVQPESTGDAPEWAAADYAKFLRRLLDEGRDITGF